MLSILLKRKIGLKRGINIFVTYKCNGFLKIFYNVIYLIEEKNRIKEGD
jgi:hypothetical protein